MRRIVAASLIVMIIASALALRPGAGVSAHPLGNFTINHFTRIDVSETGITVYRVLDMAEIPAFQQRQALDADGDGEVSPQERDAFALRKAAELAAGMALRIDGEPLALETSLSAISFPAGEAGLSLLRFEVTYRASLPDGWRDATPHVTFEDRNYPDRIGWREVVVRGGPGVELIGADVPAASTSDELRAYPDASLSSPLDVRSASFAFRPGVGAPLAPAAHPREDEAIRGNRDGSLGRYSDLIASEDLGFGVAALALLAAVGFGAIHALGPGHGKTVVAAYLVGSRGTARHALLLGLVVTATHTSSVYLLGGVTLYLSGYVVPEDLYPWMGIVSGGLVLLMGVSLLAARLRSSGLLSAGIAWLASAVRMQRPLLSAEDGAMRVVPFKRSASDHEPHPHPGVAGHGEPHTHRHGFGPAHTHRMPGQDGEQVTWRGLVGLGVFGGMIPCPSAIVVMLSAIALHRVAFGLLLIVAFSAGLAAVLMAIGLALVYAPAIGARVPLVRSLARRAGGSRAGALAVRVFPLASAAAVVIAGFLITARALMEQGAL